MPANHTQAMGLAVTQRSRAPQHVAKVQPEHVAWLARDLLAKQLSSPLEVTTRLQYVDKRRC